MAGSLNLFVSYSWGVEEETRVLDEIAKLCVERNISLIRDQHVLKHGDPITRFMETLAGGHHILLVLSKRYFESRWCMYELMRTYQNSHFSRSVHVLIADDCTVRGDDNYHANVVVFWGQELAKAQQRFPNKSQEYRHLTLYEDIKQFVERLLGYVSGMNVLPFPLLQQGNYATILDKISPLPVVLHTSIFQPSQSDQDFMLEIKLRVQEALDKSNSLRKAIAEQVGAKGSDENSDKLACILIERCANRLDELLRDDVFGAVDTTLQAFAGQPDNASPLVVKDVQQLTSSADTLFSCLVLYAVREQWMADYHTGCRQAASNLRQMPFGAAAAVEIVTSRHLQRVPRFKLNAHKSEIMGEEGVAALEQGFEKDDIVTGILRQIWVKVFPMDSPENLNEKRLGAQIKTRHKRKGVKKNNYYLVVTDDVNHPLTDSAVRDELIRRLPELPLIILKTADCGDALLIPDDEELVSIIFDFYLMLDEYIPYEPDKNRRRSEET